MNPQPIFPECFCYVTALVVTDTFNRYLKSEIFFAETGITIPKITRAVLIGSASFFLHYNQIWCGYKIDYYLRSMIYTYFFLKIYIFTHFQHKKKIMSIQPRNTSVVYFVVKSFLIVMQKEWSRSDQNCPSYRGNGDATPCRGKKMTPNNGEPYPWQPAK